jgi:hypothetical protein
VAGPFLVAALAGHEVIRLTVESTAAPFERQKAHRQCPPAPGADFRASQFQHDAACRFLRYFE